MAKYRVLASSFINNALVQEGDVVEYDGKPGSSLELIEEGKPEGKAKGQGKGKGAAPAESEAGSDAGGDQA